MARFPKGTVTFLAATLNPLAADQSAPLLRTAITSQGGVVFYDTGSAIQAAFSSSLAALEAALKSQRRIYQAEQSSGQQPGVGMALHTGRSQEREGRYTGLTFNRVLSILAAAHAGQILLSVATHNALEEQIPAEAQLQHLGEYRLKDLFRSEDLYQISAPGLPSVFPALHTLDVCPHNLPIQDSPLIGREQEVASVCTLLRDPATRLLSLLGASGMGKTRLALQIAVELIDEFADGVYFVALAPVNDPLLLVVMIAQVLGVKEQPGQPLLETLSSFLGAKQMLLVLDNFEQLLVSAPMISELIQATRQITLLVTTQEALNLAEEQIFAVPPLAMPDADEQLSIAGLSQVPAVALFVERARDVQPSFTLTRAVAPAVIELCTRLEGLPLAIELVAAQSKRYFPGDMVVLLQNRLSVARTIRRGNTREDTLRPVLDWICDVLGPGGAGLFARLGVFAGGCTSESASAICNPTNDLALDVDQALTLLLENHLLLREELKQGHVRYTMLDAIHDYTRQRLTKRRELTRLQSAHASYYTELGETAEPLLKTAEQEHWLARLEDEHHNLRAALGWALVHQPDLALRLSGALARFWYMHGHFREGSQWLQSALEQAPTPPPASRAKTLHGLGLLAYALAEYDTATAHYEAVLAIRRELGDSAGIGQMLNNLGIIAMHRGDYAQAARLYEACAPLYRDLADSWSLGAVLGNLGLLALYQADFAQAISYSAESAALSRQIGDTWGVAIALHNLGIVAYHQGDYRRARELFNEGLVLGYEINDESIQANIFGDQGLTELAEGNLAEARRLLVASIGIRQRLSATLELAGSLEAWAALRLAEQQVAAVPRLLGAAASLRTELGAPPTAVDRILIAATTTAALAQISQADFEAAFQVGAAVPLNDLLAEILATPAPDQ